MAPDAPLWVPEMMDTPPIRLLSSSELVASAASSFICIVFTIKNRPVRQYRARIK